MILEGLVTSTNADGTPHLAPMGPWMSADVRQFLLRPFPTSHTYQNLVRHGEGVLHVTDDALLLAKAAVGTVVPFPAVRLAQTISGFVLAEACRFYEFQIRSIDTSEPRAKLVAEITHVGAQREFFGFNRAKHAIVEAAILATRLHILDATEVLSEFRKFRVIVEKTGGAAELEAMTFLEQHAAMTHPEGWDT